MAKKEKDVKVVSSTTEEEVKETETDVKKVEETVEDTSTQETLKETLEPGEAQVGAFDERGVPWRNVAAEKQRKLDELADNLPRILDEKLSQFKPQEQKRSIAEIEAFAQQNPEYRPWAEEEKAKLQREEFLKLTDERIKKADESRQADFKKQQSLQFVMQTYPECFVKDAQGKIVGWNQDAPLTKEIGVLMQDKRLSGTPEGLSVAADIAFARSARMKRQKDQTKEIELKSEVKELQKRTLTEGGGKTSTELPPVRKAIDRLKETGSIKDAQLALSELMKARRESKE